MDSKKKPAKGSPKWMTTFADLSTLLLTFFIIMLSMANVDVIKFRELLGSVRDAFGVQFEEHDDYQAATKQDLYQMQSKPPEKTTETDRQKQSAAEDRQDRQEAVDEIRNTINQTNMGDMAEIKNGSRGIRMRIKGALLFDPGKAALKKTALPLIDSLAEVLYKRGYYLLVEGHTDASPIATERFPSNWELSGSRAAAVLRHLIATGIDSKRLTCVGLADGYPLADNDSEQGRSENRRVEFVLTKQPFRPEIN